MKCQLAIWIEGITSIRSSGFAYLISGIFVIKNLKKRSQIIHIYMYLRTHVFISDEWLIIYGRHHR